MKHALYRGCPQAVADVPGGTVDILIDNLAAMPPLLKQGGLRVLPASSQQRMPQLSTVPSAPDWGLYGFESLSWCGFLLPRRAAAVSIKNLNAAVSSGLAASFVHKLCMSSCVEIVGGKPEALADLAKLETVKRSKVVKRSGVLAQ